MEMSPSLYILSLQLTSTRNPLHTLNTEISESVIPYSVCVLACGGQRSVSGVALRLLDSPLCFEIGSP